MSSMAWDFHGSKVSLLLVLVSIIKTPETTSSWRLLMASLTTLHLTWEKELVTDTLKALMKSQFKLTWTLKVSIRIWSNTTTTTFLPSRIPTLIRINKTTNHTRTSMTALMVNKTKNHPCMEPLNLSLRDRERDHQLASREQENSRRVTDQSLVRNPPEELQ